MLHSRGGLCRTWLLILLVAASLDLQQCLLVKPSRLQTPRRISRTRLCSQEEPTEEVPSLAAEKRQLTRDFLLIGAPALLQLTAEPLAGIVDTAYLGRLSPAVLGGAGVAVSAQYAVSKLYNDPLLRTSISLVASSDDDQGLAVSSALLLAGTVGILQMFIFGLFSTAITRSMVFVESGDRDARSDALARHEWHFSGTRRYTHATHLQSYR